MNRSQIYRKSAKGAQAIATRQHGLGPKQRSMLILVDGKRGWDELERLSAMLGDTALLMAELDAGGFIEATPPAAAPATSTPAPPVPAISLDEARRFAAHALEDLMGPMAEEICMRIEAAKDPAELAALVKRAEAILREVRGPSVARDFAAAIASRSSAP